jgi:pimeloyl-ACP methyl ester carboxylesterase
MSIAIVNGVRLFYTLTGDHGPPIVLVHGAWGNHTAWEPVVPDLARRFRVLTYDRRGHSQSERTLGRRTTDSDTADLAALVAHIGLGPAHVVGNSFGGSVALRLAARHPDLVSSLAIHEPPLFDLNLDDPAGARAVRQAKASLIEGVAARLAEGDVEGGTREFFDTAFGTGTWEWFSSDVRQTFLENAQTFLDDARDPEAYSVDLVRLSSFPQPVLLTHGDQSSPLYAAIATKLGDALPHAETRTWAGVGHVPQTSHPEEFVEVVTVFATAVDTAEPE